MDIDRTSYATLGLLTVLMGITIHGFTQISGDVAIHFNQAGQPDNTMGKIPGLLILPAVSIGLLALLRYLPNIDPIRDGKEELEFAVKGLSLFIVGFLTYMQALIILWNTGYIFDISRAITLAVAALFYGIGVLLQKADRNWFIDIRTPWTLSSDEVWKKTHRKCSPLFKFMGVFVLGAVAFPEKLLLFVIVPAVLISIYATVYSSREYQRLEE